MCEGAYVCVYICIYVYRNLSIHTYTRINVPRHILGTHDDRLYAISYMFIHQSLEWPEGEGEEGAAACTACTACNCKVLVVVGLGSSFGRLNATQSTRSSVKACCSLRVEPVSV